MEPNYPALEPLFEIKLEYKESAPPVSLEGKVGEYIGSGEGRVEGPQIQGTVHWTLFESVQEVACQSNLFGIITAEDGAEINFDSMGIFMVPDKEKPHLWGQRLGLVSRPMIKGIAGSTRSLGYGKANLIVNHTAIIIVFTQEASNPHLQTNSVSIEFMNVKKDF